MNSKVKGLISGLALVLSIGCNQKDLDIRHPMSEMATFKFADPELEISLIASEPDIISPVDMAWGPGGSLYVVEMTGYPITENKGKIKKLTDPDGDGRYTLESVYAEGLNFPASIMYYRGGLLVADAPDILFLYDADNDGVAEQKEVFITGFVPGNQQYRANALQWGLDNWIYGANGRAGGKLRFGGDTNIVNIDSRDFRVKPFTKEIQAISGLSQFGLAMDNWGNRFISYNHRFARQVMLEEEHLLRNPALTTDAVFDTSLHEHDRRVWTLLTSTMRFNRDPIGYFTSLSGLKAYRGNLLGLEYDGNLFAGESVQAAVISRRMQKNGAAFQAIDMEKDAEFLVSTDDWFHPVSFSNGPDGALYMVDFYRKFVEHPEWANDEKEDGIDWNLGEKHGRIWRISQKGNEIDPHRMRPNLDKATLTELVKQFEDGAAWRRDMAQQLLVDSQNKKALEPLEKMLTSDSPLARNHAYWTLEGLDLLEPRHITQALEDENTNVVLQGIKLAEKDSLPSDSIKEKLVSLANNEEGEIRFRAILALGSEKSLAVQNGLIKSASNYSDRWTQVALLSSVAEWPLYFAQGLLAENKNEANCEKSLSFYRQIGNLMAYTTNEDVNTWLKKLIDSKTKDNCDRWALLAGYANALKELGKPLPTFSNTIYDYAMENLEQNPENPIAHLGVELLEYSSFEIYRKKFIEFLIHTESSSIQVAGIQMFSNLEEEKYMNQLYENINTMGLAARKELIASARNSKTASLSLLNAIDQEQIQATEIPEELRYALLYNDDSQVQETAKKLLVNSVNSDRDALVKEYLPAIQNQTVNIELGANTFTTNCSTCHSINGKGGNLGPDLTNIGSRSDEVLLTSILDPSRMVSYELKLHVVTTNSGKVYSGTVSAETTSSITIKQSDGQEHTILNKNIKDRTTIDQSIMPEGYERIIDKKAMANLIAFLRNPI